MTFRCVSLSVAVCMTFAVPVAAAPILELEPNDTLAAAQLIPSLAFTLPVPADVFDLGFRTASISGSGGDEDIDFYAFNALGGQVYFDIDSEGSPFDSILSLFNSAGTLLAYGDESNPVDPGSTLPQDAFVGVYTLPGPGTYYLAVSGFANFPSAVFSGSQTDLVRPDGALGGAAVSGATPGDSSFVMADFSVAGPYQLHVSVQNPTPSATPVPEPASMMMLVTCFLALSARHRRQFRTR